MPDIKEMRLRLHSVSVTDRLTRETLKKIYDIHGAKLEPHGAVGWAGLESWPAHRANDQLSVVVETAHPAKFPELVREAIGIEPEIPLSMKDLGSRTGTAIQLSADYQEIKKFLIKEYSLSTV